jgi:hypothetical protein
VCQHLDDLREAGLASYLPHQKRKLVWVGFPCGTPTLALTTEIDDLDLQTIRGVKHLRL